MKKSRYNDLLKTMAIQTTSYETEKMRAFVMQQLESIEGVTAVEYKGNIYAAKGEAETYPCIVAHTDTVHDMYDDFQMFRSRDNLFSIDGKTMERVGIGGDDKVGVFVALQVIKELDVCKVAFFRDEEVGCVGSRDAEMTFFENCEFVLQCDRQGYKDFVNEIYGTKLFSDEFSHGISAILDKWSRKESSGGLTDVYQLVENGYKGCVANMCCGYYDPHSYNEYIKISEVDETLDMVLEIFEAMSGQMWLVPDKDRKVYKGGYGLGFGSNARNYNGYGDYDDWYTDRELEEMAKKDKTPVIQIDTPSTVLINNCAICSSQQIIYDEMERMMWCYNCEDYGPATIDEAIIFLDKEDHDITLEEYFEKRQDIYDQLENESEDDEDIDDNMKVA